MRVPDPNILVVRRPLPVREGWDLDHHVTACSEGARACWGGGGGCWACFRSGPISVGGGRGSKRSAPLFPGPQGEPAHGLHPHFVVAEIWADWGAGGGRGERPIEGGGSTITAPTPPPSQAATQAPPPFKKTFQRTIRLRVRLGQLRPRSPVAKSPTPPPPTTTAQPTKAVSAPKPSPPPPPPRPPPPTPRPLAKTDTPKGAEKKDDRPDNPIIGTVVHVTYPTGVRKGTVRGFHGRKYGAVWVEYPGGTTLYELAQPLLFPTPEEAERVRDEAQSGRKKPKPPAPTNEDTNLPNPNPTTEPTNPAHPPSGPTKTWDPITGSHEV